MVSKYYKKSICLLIIVINIGISCKKFVQVDPPVTQLVTASVFSNTTTATGAVVNIYRLMSSNKESYYISQNTGLLSDELTNYSSGLPQIQFYTNGLIADKSTYTGPWQNAYDYIYQANAVIEGLMKYDGIANSVKSQLSAEAKFIRAFWFFYLTNIYGDIPMPTSTDYTINQHLSRTPRAKVYDQIVNDLKDAQAGLSDNYIDGSDTAITPERTRPNKSTATALLARTYLYLGDYNNAEIQATNVINNSLYRLEPDLNNVFLTTSQEAIWQLGAPLPYITGSNTQEGFDYICNSALNNGAVSLSPQLLNTFDSSDKRMSAWVGLYSPSVTTNYFYPYKYKVLISDKITEYVTVFRLAEQYLIRAEARAQGSGGGISGAISDLDTIRSRAGLLPYNGPSNGTSLIAAILQERRLELFTEWGHRWFDLNRTGNIEKVMGGSNGVTAQKGGIWDQHDVLYPIPLPEIRADVNLTQNDGYED